MRHTRFSRYTLMHDGSRPRGTHELSGRQRHTADARCTARTARTARASAALDEDENVVLGVRGRMLWIGEAAVPLRNITLVNPHLAKPDRWSPPAAS